MIADRLWVDRRHRLPSPHQPRRRRDCLGELVQIDGSEHAWFEDRSPMCTFLAFVLCRQANTTCLPSSLLTWAACPRTSATGSCEPTARDRHRWKARLPALRSPAWQAGPPPPVSEASAYPQGSPACGLRRGHIAERQEFCRQCPGPAVGKQGPHLRGDPLVFGCAPVGHNLGDRVEPMVLGHLSSTGQKRGAPTSTVPNTDTRRRVRTSLSGR